MNDVAVPTSPSPHAVVAGEQRRDGTGVPIARDASPRVKERLVWIDAAKGLSMVLVVLLHSSNWFVDDKHLGPSLWLSVSHALQPLRMPLFFMVSGLLIAGSMATNRGKLARRAISLFSVYVLWTSIHAARLVAMPTAAAAPFSASLLVWSTITPGIYWYIWGLPLYYLITITLFVGVRDRDTVPRAAYLGLAVSAIISFYWHPLSDAWTGALDLNRKVEFNFTGSLVRNYFWFLSGVLFSRQLLSSTRRLPQQGVAAITVGIVLVTAGSLLSTLGEHWEFSIAPFLMVPGVIVLLRRFGEARFIDTLVVIGRQTLPVYIFHFFVLNALSFFLVHAHVAAPVPSIYGYVVPPLMTLCIVPLTISIGKALRAAHLGVVLDGVPDGLSRPAPRVAVSA